MVKLAKPRIKHIKKLVVLNQKEIIESPETFVADNNFKKQFDLIRNLKY